MPSPSLATLINAARGFPDIERKITETATRAMAYAQLMTNSERHCWRRNQMSKQVGENITATNNKPSMFAHRRQAN